MLLVWAGMLDLVFKLAALVTVYAKPIPSAHQAVLLPWGGDIKAWLRDGVFDWNARITGARGPMRSPLLALPLLKFRYRQCSGDSASSFPWTSRIRRMSTLGIPSGCVRLRARHWSME